MTKTWVFLNPNAAGGRAASLQSGVVQWLRQHAPGTEFTAPASAKEGRQQLQGLAPGTRVVVIGGDGTLNQLLPVLLQGQHTLGLVPFGSGNDTARALKLHRVPWTQALAHALHATAQPVDVGMATFDTTQGESRQVPMLSSLTAGFDSSVGLRALNGPRWLRGLPRYLLATLRELASLRTWNLQVLVDGLCVHEGPALFASTLNTPSFGSGMPAVPQAKIDDGQLDLLVAGRFGVASTLLMLPRLMLGAHLSHPRVHSHPLRRLNIRADTPVPLAADGEYLGETLDLSVRVLPGALSVVRGPVTE